MKNCRIRNYNSSLSHTFRNYAFISYSHRDIKVARWLQKRLEGYRLPIEKCNDIEPKTRYLRPIFRDQSDLDTGILSDELRWHLEESKYLILICSKHSATSRWVSDEAQAFVEMGRLDRIIPLIVSDSATPESDLFPLFLREYFDAYPDKELLGVNIGEVGKEKAVIRIVARMLEVSFDSLWNRHLRQRRQKILTSFLSAMALGAGTYIFAVPVSLTFSLSSQPAELPIPERLALKIGDALYTSSTTDTTFHDINLPGYYRLRPCPISVKAEFFQSIDTTIRSNIGIKNMVKLILRRDDSFAVFRGYVLDSEMHGIPEVDVSVANVKTRTDSVGVFDVRLPVALQRESQAITLRKVGYRTKILEEETPSENLKYILHHENVVD